MKHDRRYRQLLLMAATALTLGAGIVLAAQDFDFDRGSSGQRSAWVPGTDVPMLTYLGDRNSLPAPPR